MGAENFCWILLFVFPVRSVFGSVLISSPFDNFRLECAQMSGAQRISVRMVESQGQKRQDTVFAISCNKVQELYPWFGIPQGVEDIEREDCHYSPMFDPIMDDFVNNTCGEREYITGITRMSDTRIQVMCCRLRSRDEKECHEMKFAKPIVNEGRIEIENNAQLINSIAIKGNYYVVRFCDLGPRPIGFIVEDIPTTTPKPTTKPWAPKRTQKIKKIPTTLPPQTQPTTERTTLTSTTPPWWTTLSTRSPMRVIKVAQPAFLRNPEAWDINMNHQLRAQLPTDQVRIERPHHAELQGPLESSTLSQNDINSNVDASISIEFHEKESRRHQIDLVSSLPATKAPRSRGDSRQHSSRSHEVIQPLRNGIEMVRPNRKKVHGLKSKTVKKPTSSTSSSIEYDYDEKTSKELMKSIIDFMEAQKRAKTMIEKIKSSEALPNQKSQYQMAHRLLKEMEALSPDLVGSLVKSSEKEGTTSSSPATPALDFESIEQVAIPESRQPQDPEWSQIASIPLESSTTPKSHTPHKSSSKEHTATQKDKSKRLYLFISSTMPPLTTVTEPREPTTTKDLSPEEWFHQMTKVITSSAEEIPKTVPETSTVPIKVFTKARQKPRLVDASSIENEEEYDLDDTTTPASKVLASTQMTDEHRDRNGSLLADELTKLAMLGASKEEDDSDDFEDITVPETSTTVPQTTTQTPATLDPFYATMSTGQTWSTAGDIYTETSNRQTTQETTWNEANVVTFKPIEEERFLENLKNNDVEIRKSPQRIRPVDEFVGLAPFDAFPSPPPRGTNSLTNNVELPRRPPKLRPQLAHRVMPTTTATANPISTNLAPIQPIQQTPPRLAAQQHPIMPQIHGITLWGPQNRPVLAANRVWDQTQANHPQFWQGTQGQFFTQHQPVNPIQHQSWMLQSFGQPQQSLQQHAQQIQPQQWQQSPIAQVLPPQVQQIQPVRQVQQPPPPPRPVQDAYPTQEQTTRRTVEGEAASIEPVIRRRRPKPTPAPRYPLPNSRGKIFNQPYVDEETEDSPFDYAQGAQIYEEGHQKHRSGSIDPEVLESFSYDGAPQEVEISEDKPKSPFDMSKEIRRAPMPRHNNQAFDPTTKVNQEPTEFSHDQKVTTEKSRVADKLGMNMVFPTFDDAQPPEYEIDMPNLGSNHNDGLKVYGPKDEKPMETKGTMAEMLENMNLADAYRENEKAKMRDGHEGSQKRPSERDLIQLKKRRPIKNEDSSSDQTTPPTEPPTPITTEAISSKTTTSERNDHPDMEQDSVLAQWERRRFKDVPQPQQSSKSTSTEAYDLRNFYHTLKPKQPPPKEKYLTFCTKEVAIHDENNLVVACGSELEVWTPSRCPPGSDCFIAPDSTYRICCPVYTGK